MSNKPSHTPARSPRREQSTHSPGGHRQERLEHILLDEVQWLIREEARDAALVGVRVVSVSLSPDGGHARIGYAVEAQLNQESEVERRSKEALDRAAGFLRARLAAGLDLKRTPKLSFVFMGVVELGTSSSATGGHECLE
jgi:ribosome-binding factor A